jgi:hypothetical protein
MQETPEMIIPAGSENKPTPTAIEINPAICKTDASKLLLKQKTVESELQGLGAKPLLCQMQ